MGFSPLGMRPCFLFLDKSSVIWFVSMSLRDAHLQVNKVLVLGVGSLFFSIIEEDSFQWL